MDAGQVERRGDSDAGLCALNLDFSRFVMRRTQGACIPTVVVDNPVGLQTWGALSSWLGGVAQLAGHGITVLPSCPDDECQPEKGVLARDSVFDVGCQSAVGGVGSFSRVAIDDVCADVGVDDVVDVDSGDGMCYLAAVLPECHDQAKAVLEKWPTVAGFVSLPLEWLKSWEDLQSLFVTEVTGDCRDVGGEPRSWLHLSYERRGDALSVADFLSVVRELYELGRSAELEEILSMQMGGRLEVSQSPELLSSVLCDRVVSGTARTRGLAVALTVGDDAVQKFFPIDEAGDGFCYRGLLSDRGKGLLCRPFPTFAELVALPVGAYSPVHWAATVTRTCVRNKHIFHIVYRPPCDGEYSFRSVMAKLGTAVSTEAADCSATLGAFKFKPVPEGWIELSDVVGSPNQFAVWLAGLANVSPDVYTHGDLRIMMNARSVLAVGEQEQLRMHAVLGGHVLGVLLTSQVIRSGSGTVAQINQLLQEKATSQHLAAVFSSHVPGEYLMFAGDTVAPASATDAIKAYFGVTFRRAGMTAVEALASRFGLITSSQVGDMFVSYD